MRAMRIIKFLFVAAIVAYTCAQDGDGDSGDLTAADLLSHDDADIHHCTIKDPEKQVWFPASSAKDILLTCTPAYSPIGMLPGVMVRI